MIFRYALFFVTQNWSQLTFTCLDMELVTLLVILKHFNKIFWYISLLYSPECSRSCESGAVTCQSWQLLERHQRHNGRQHSTHGDREKQPLDYHARDDDHHVFLHHHQSWNHQKITQMQKTAAFFNITWEHTGTPSLPTPLTFWIFLHIIHPQWKCQTRRKKGADSETKTDDLYQKRDEEEDLCLLCIFACVCCFRFSFVSVYVDCDHLNLGSIEMKVVPQQKELMIIWI